jgi:predicted transcriptional regulator
MRSIRLSDELEQQLEAIAERKNVSRSVIIKEALAEYIARDKEHFTSYEAGAHLFGRYGSEQTDASQNYKSIIREKLREKHAR